jgi:hypothetical protein
LKNRNYQRGPLFRKKKKDERKKRGKNNEDCDETKRTTKDHTQAQQSYQREEKGRGRMGARGRRAIRYFLKLGRICINGGRARN